MSTALIHGGLPKGVRRHDLLSLVEGLGRRGLGISSTAVWVLRHYVWRSRDSDYEAGRICAVWDRVSRSADELCLCSRAINEAERELEREGLIVRTTGGNGARSGLRSDGRIRWAAGINLAPLIERYVELKAVWDALCLQQHAVAQCKAEIRRLRRLIRSGGEAEALVQADAILPDGRVAPLNRIEKLEAIRAALEALLAEVSDASRATKTSDRSEENFAPNIHNHHSSRSCSAAEPETVTPAAALDLASEEYRTLANAMGGPTWSVLVEASARTSGQIGISQRAWGQACQSLGRERAALCVLVIDRNVRLQSGHRFAARHPGRCLSGMVRRSVEGSFNLQGLLRAIQREPAATAARHPYPSIPEEAAAGSIAFLTSQILARTARRMGDNACS